MNTTDDLTRSLREQADRVGGHPIDFEAVRGRARGIQRRRRLAAGAGVLAAVAVIAPIAVTATGGLQRGEDAVPPATEVPSPTPVGKVKAVGASAPRGAEPSIPWLDGAVLHQPDGSTTDLGTAYYDVTPYEGGWAGVDLSEGTISFLDAGGRILQTFRGQSLAVTTDGEWMAAALTASAGDQDVGLFQVAGDGPGGYLSTVVAPDGTVDLAGFTGRQEVAYDLTRPNGQTDAWLTDWARDPRPIPGLIRVRATSEAAGLVSGLTSIDELEPGSCSAVVAVKTGQTRWETCDYTLESFSPDGRYVIGTDPYHDGLGGSTVAVLDATDGTTLVEYSTRNVGFTGSAVWETSSTILMTTHQDGRWYALRLGLDGEVTQALDPVRAGDLDNPWGWSLRP